MHKVKEQFYSLNLLFVTGMVERCHRTLESVVKKKSWGMTGG